MFMMRYGSRPNLPPRGLLLLVVKLYFQSLYIFYVLPILWNSENCSKIFKLLLLGRASIFYENLKFRYSLALYHVICDLVWCKKQNERSCLKWWRKHILIGLVWPIIIIVNLSKSSVGKQLLHLTSRA